MAIPLVGDINKSIAFGRTQIGKPYDHQESAQRFGLAKYDCSGYVSRCLWEGGMPRGYAGFGESSNSMAMWSHVHPEFRLPLSAQNTVVGAIIVYGGTGGAGAAGHVVIGLGNGQCINSDGSHGVEIVPLSYFANADGGVSDVLLAPVNYDFVKPPPPPPPPEDDMFRVIKGDKFEDRWLTNWLGKRHIGTGPGMDAAAKSERDAIIAAGVTGGAPEVVWPQAWVDEIPTKT